MMRTAPILLTLSLLAGASWGISAFASENLAIRFVTGGAFSLGPGSALLLAVVSARVIAAEKSAR